MGIRKTYRVRVAGGGGRSIVALDGVSMTVNAGSVHAVVGESGSGKTTLTRVVLGLVRPDAGRVSMNGVDFGEVSGRQRRSLRRHVQAVFQDSAGSLDPRRTIAWSIAEPLVVHRECARTERGARVESLLDEVGLDPALARRYPRQLSAGQRQRAAIARALALRPQLVVCDEAVSALDASTRAEILELFADLRRRLGLAYLFVSHDLDAVARIATDISVLYQGRIVETGPCAKVLATPAHPYTAALLAAAAATDPERVRAHGLPAPGDIEQGRP